MRLLLNIFLALLLLISGCTVPIIKSELDLEMEKIIRNPPSEIVWAGKMFAAWDEKWKVAYRARQGTLFIYEHVLPPETVENWTELLTISVQYSTSKVYTYPGGKTLTEIPDPVVSMEGLRSVMQDRCAKPISFQRLDNDLTPPYPSVTFFISCEQFTSTAVNPELPEAQVHRMLKGQRALYHTSRIRHASTLDQATMDLWAQGLNALYVCDNNVSGHECNTK